MFLVASWSDVAVIQFLPITKFKYLIRWSHLSTVLGYTAAQLITSFYNGIRACCCWDMKSLVLTTESWVWNVSSNLMNSAAMFLGFFLQAIMLSWDVYKLAVALFYGSWLSSKHCMSHVTDFGMNWCSLNVIPVSLGFLSSSGGSEGGGNDPQRQPRAEEEDAARQLRLWRPGWCNGHAPGSVSCSLSRPHHHSRHCRCSHHHR